MAKKVNMKHISILLTDSDGCLAQACISNLRAMGFSNVTHVKSVASAIAMLHSQVISLLITEWDMQGPSGIELVQFLRHSAETPNRALPIIMLTGRGELSDVQAARDLGITEFVVKPFSAQTLFNRLEQVIDHPRNFVLSQAFIGPERRRREGKPPGDAPERRVLGSFVHPFSREGVKKEPTETPVIFLADPSLRQALGTGLPLTSIITPEILKAAQEAIDNLREQSLNWIRDDLEQMKKSNEVLTKIYSAYAFESVKTAALSIKSRSGTFGYRLASDVARLLYLFMSTHFFPSNPMHLVVIQKHIDVLTVVFAQKIREREGIGAELYNELERLISVHK